jgi:hypothetical protein
MEMTGQTSTKAKKSRSSKKMLGDKSAPSKGEQAKARIISAGGNSFQQTGLRRRLDA